MGRRLRSASVGLIGGMPGGFAGELLLLSCGRSVAKMLARCAGYPVLRFAVVSGSGGGGRTDVLEEEQANPVLGRVAVVGVVPVAVSVIIKRDTEQSGERATIGHSNVQ